jgi:hypothetical protein
VVSIDHNRAILLRLMIKAIPPSYLTLCERRTTSTQYPIQPAKFNIVVQVTQRGYLDAKNILVEKVDSKEQKTCNLPYNSKAVFWVAEKKYIIP